MYLHAISTVDLSEQQSVKRNFTAVFVLRLLAQVFCLKTILGLHLNPFLLTLSIYCLHALRMIFFFCHSLFADFLSDDSYINLSIFISFSCLLEFIFFLSAFLFSKKHLFYFLYVCLSRCKCLCWLCTWFFVIYIFSVCLLVAFIALIFLSLSFYCFFLRYNFDF